MNPRSLLWVIIVFHLVAFSAVYDTKGFGPACVSTITTAFVSLGVYVLAGVFFPDDKKP